MTPSPRRLLRLLGWLRFLLIWPIFRAYRRRAARSLRWRLAGSHLATVFLSVVAISVVGSLAVVVFTFVFRPADREPALEAAIVADLLQEANAERPLTPTETSAILKAIAVGALGPNLFNNDVNIWADIGRQFANISSISVVAPSGYITASSDPSLVGRQVLLAGPAAPGVAARALAGSTDTDANTVIRPGTTIITGAYPLRGPNDEVIGAVVVDKSGRSIPSDWRLFVLALNYVGTLGLLILVLIGLPAIPVGTIIGIRRARAISRPVDELARVGEAFTRGNLAARVAPRGSDEIARLEHGFNTMADHLTAVMAQEAAQRRRAEGLLQANRDLIANVSHELRTPVALVRGHLEALQSDPAAVDECVRIALRETDRLERLVDDLFQLTRIESQGLALDLDRIDAGSAAREAVESLAELARREAGITMETHIEAGDLTGVGDRARLVQVLQNLIRNAIRYTPEGGIILVSVCDKEDHVEIAVRDTGVGIPPDALTHIFERFYRADQSRSRAGGGAGLGLAIAHDLIEAMGGTIAVESVVAEGSLFTIRLPRAATPSADGSAPRVAAAAER